jgi:hypothetical protein
MTHHTHSFVFIEENESTKSSSQDGGHCLPVHPTLATRIGAQPA